MFQSNLDAVDDMLLLQVAVVEVEVVRADDLDQRGWGASKHHVDYVASVRCVEAEITNFR